MIGGFQVMTTSRSLTRWHSLLLQCAAGAIPVALLLWANWRTTGSPLLFAYDALNGPGHGLGFHSDPTGAIHTPLRALVITSGYLMKLNRYLFEWPIPALLIIGATLLAVRNATKWELLLAALATAVIGAYAAYWFDGFFAGPRFLYMAVPAFVLFAARMPQTLGERLGAVPRRAVVLVIPLCVLYAWLVPTGVSSVQMRAYYYRELRSKLKTDIERQIASAPLESALVFVRESWHARLVARLRALDMPPAPAEKLLDVADACALQSALDAEDTLPSRISAERLARVLERVRRAGRAEPVPGLPIENRIAIVPGSRPTPACLREVAMDQEGTMPYALFLARQQIGADGRVGGRIVFVRDMGVRNELLRERFTDRTWYRYRAPKDLADRGTVFVPYERVGVARR